MLDSSTLSWLRTEIVVFVLAALGGIVVIIGLWWEYKSTDETRYEKAGIDEFRSLKALEKRGEKWVIAGIIIEVIVAVVFAWRDDWHIRQVEANTPIKMRAETASAVAVIQLQTWFDEKNLPALRSTAPWTASLRFQGTNNGFHPFMDLYCFEKSWPAAYADKVLPLQFEWKRGTGWSGISDPDKPADELLDEFKHFSIQAFGILGDETNLILGGSVTLVLNGSVSKTFPIPPQTLFSPRKNPQTGRLESKMEITDSTNIDTVIELHPK